MGGYSNEKNEPFRPFPLSGRHDRRAVSSADASVPAHQLRRRSVSDLRGHDPAARHFPEATIGLTLGCFLSNFLAGANVYDVVFGTLATLLAALISWRVGKKKLWYAAIPPVVCNGVIVGLVLTYAYQIPALWMNMLTVAAGEAVVCFALGVPLVRFLNKHKDKLL